MHTQEWNNKLCRFNIPVYCGRSCTVCCAWVLLDKTDILTQDQCPRFAFEPFYKNLFTSQFSFTLCLFFLNGSLWSWPFDLLWMDYEDFISEVDRLSLATKGILILWNEEVKQSGGNRAERKKHSLTEYWSMWDQTWELYLSRLSVDRGGSFFKLELVTVLAPSAKPRTRTKLNPSPMIF